MAQGRRDHLEREVEQLDERVEQLDEKVSEVSEKVDARAPVDPEAAVQLRWVYSPGETRLQLKQGSDPWVTVPHVTLEEAEAEAAAETEKDDKSAR